MKQEHERLEREEKELRNHIENMKMLRLYLNKNLEGSAKNHSNIRSIGKSSVGGDNFWTGGN